MKISKAAAAIFLRHRSPSATLSDGGPSMLELKCDKCGRELREPGALILSPPTTKEWLVEKYHVCADCWPAVSALLKETPARPAK
jgi:hypothetical protein